MISAASNAGKSRTATRLPAPLRRRQLLEAAEQVFIAQGYHGTAMDDIAERAGISKPVLYKHFPGKLDLYLALLDTHCDVLLTKVRYALDATNDSGEQITGAMRAYFDFVGQDNGAFRLLFESDLRSNSSVRKRVERTERSCINAITDIILRDTKMGRNIAELIAAALVGAATSAARYWLTTGRQLAPPAAEELISSLVRYGIGSFPVTEGTA
jgi:AcrR family transcriptional regulator